MSKELVHRYVAISKRFNSIKGNKNEFHSIRSVHYFVITFVRKKRDFYTNLTNCSISNAFHHTKNKQTEERIRISIRSNRKMESHCNSFLCCLFFIVWCIYVSMYRFYRWWMVNGEWWFWVFVWSDLFFISLFSPYFSSLNRIFCAYRIRERFPIATFRDESF